MDRGNVMEQERASTLIREISKSEILLDVHKQDMIDFFKGKIRLEGISLRNVACKTDYSHTHIRNVFMGKTKISVSFCYSIYNALFEDD